jgi:hypothetical protein
MMRTDLVGYPTLGVCVRPSRMKRFGANAWMADRAIKWRRVNMIIAPAGSILTFYPTTSQLTHAPQQIACTDSNNLLDHLVGNEPSSAGGTVRPF